MKPAMWPGQTCCKDPTTREGDVSGSRLFGPCLLCLPDLRSIVLMGKHVLIMAAIYQVLFAIYWWPTCQLQLHHRYMLMVKSLIFSDRAVRCTSPWCTTTRCTVHLSLLGFPRQLVNALARGCLQPPLVWCHNCHIASVHPLCSHYPH